MSSLVEKFEPSFVAVRVWFSDDSICLQLSDGRVVKTPLEFYPALRNADPMKRDNYRLIGMGKVLLPCR